MNTRKWSRREILKNIALASSVAVVSGDIYSPTRAQSLQGTTAGIDGKRPWYELGLMPDPVMDNQLLWYLSQAYQGMTDVGEVLDTASRIDAADEYSWVREWLATAERVRRYGNESLAGGHFVSAGEAFLRASSYYRAALIHHPDPLDPSVPQMALTVMELFNTSLGLLNIPAEPVRIPYEGTTLPAYFYRSSVARGRAPLLIIFEGRDAWAEETKYLADAAVKRGYHCLQVQGPGQGAVLRVQNLPFRPDWEEVVTPVVDYAVQQPGVDPEQIILLGLSFGGALVPRAAAFEKRIKICIANPGVLNWGAAIYAQLEFLAPELMDIYHTNPQAFDNAVAEVMAQVPLLGWGFRDMMWKHGASTPTELLAKLVEFNNEDIVDQIECKVLVMESEAEGFTAGQAMELYNALRSPKDFMLFTAEDTGLVHVQTGAMAVSSQRMFDWLDENL